MNCLIEENIAFLNLLNVLIKEPITNPTARKAPATAKVLTIALKAEANNLKTPDNLVMRDIACWVLKTMLIAICLAIIF